MPNPNLEFNEENSIELDVSSDAQKSSREAYFNKMQGFIDDEEEEDTPSQNLESEDDTPVEPVEPTTQEQEEEVPQDDSSEQLKRELAELRAEREAFALERANYAREIEESRKPKEPEVPKKDKTALKNEKKDKFYAFIEKIANGDQEGAKEAIDSYLDSEEIITRDDIDEISTLKAKQISENFSKEQKIQQSLIDFDNKFKNENKELENEGFQNLFNNEISKIVQTKEGSALPLEGIYKTAMTNTKNIVKALGIQVPQNPVIDSEAEKKAKRIEEAKKATIKPSTTGKPPVQKTEEEDDDIDLMAYFWKLNHNK